MLGAGRLMADLIKPQKETTAVKYRLVTANTEPLGFSTEYDDYTSDICQKDAAYLIDRGHKYVRVIEWPPREIGIWDHYGGWKVKGNK